MGECLLKQNVSGGGEPFVGSATLADAVNGIITIELPFEYSVLIVSDRVKYDNPYYDQQDGTYQIFTDIEIPTIPDAFGMGNKYSFDGLTTLIIDVSGVEEFSFDYTVYK